jgi:hypothetical protein
MLSLYFCSVLCVACVQNSRRVMNELASIFYLLLRFCYIITYYGTYNTSKMVS